MGQTEISSDISSKPGGKKEKGGKTRLSIRSIPENGGKGERDEKYVLDFLGGSSR